jgi:hypothetical protein
VLVPARLIGLRHKKDAVAVRGHEKVPTGGQV